MEYISKEGAIDCVLSQYCASSDETEEALGDAIDAIKAYPAADVEEVVRCIDCKYSVRPVLATQMKCNRDGVYRWVFFDGYCDMGERK